MPEDYGVEVLGTRRVAADHELPGMVDPHFPPRAGALAVFAGVSVASQ